MNEVAADLPPGVVVDIPTTGRHLLQMQLCHVSYGPIPALRGVSLTVDEGEMVALLGANGAGKTTTLRAISGLIHPRSGTITFDGRRIDALSPPEVVRHGIAHLPEGRDLFPSLTVGENLRYGHWPRRKERHAYAGRLDEIFALFPRLKERAKQRAGTLSGGEQQMLAVGMALMCQPRLLIVDELSLGLAPKVVRELFEALRMVNARGMAMLLVEQFVNIALANTHRAYVLAKGEVVLSKASSELQHDPAVLQAYLGDAVGQASGGHMATQVVPGEISR
jgi:branched-chain amino acid transport system ATP-binding protein